MYEHRRASARRRARRLSFNRGEKPAVPAKRSHVHTERITHNGRRIDRTVGQERYASARGSESSTKPALPLREWAEVQKMLRSDTKPEDPIDRGRAKDSTA